MRIVVLVAAMAGEIPKIAGADYIGVDKGCQHCVNQGISPILGIGDFDSTSKNFNFPLKVYPKEKDETDLELAILYSKDQYDKIIVVNCFGGRSDHFLYTLKLMQLSENIELWNNDETIKILSVGKHRIINKNQYISLFALENTEVTLHYFKYPLKNALLTPQSLKTISNVLIADEGEVEVISGKILLIETGG